jgi:hypothetical protein
MEPAERVLYHQIHPLKLGGDIAAALVSLPLMWRGHRRLGMLIHWATPIVASAVVLPRTADLERLRGSSAGRYVNHEMTPAMQAIRLIGDAITVVGAWHRRAGWIALGGLVVVAGWTLGPGGWLRLTGPAASRESLAWSSGPATAVVSEAPEAIGAPIARRPRVTRERRGS